MPTQIAPPIKTPETATKTKSGTSTSKVGDGKSDVMEKAESGQNEKAPLADLMGLVCLLRMISNILQFTEETELLKGDDMWQTTMAYRFHIL